MHTQKIRQYSKNIQLEHKCILVYIRSDTKKSDTAKNRHVIKDFCFSSNFDESWSHCSTHEYYNLTNFHQNLMKNEKYLLIAIFASVRFFLYQSLCTTAELLERLDLGLCSRSNLQLDNSGPPYNFIECRALYNCRWASFASK